MTTLYATIGRTQRERGGLILEAVLDGDAATARALEWAVGASLTEMGRGEEIAGRLLRVVAASAAKAANAGRITLYALVTGARAAALAASRVYKGLECQISLLGNEISEIALVDRPINKSSGGSSERIAVLYKRENQMSITTATHKYYGTRPSASSAEVNAVWEQMTPQQRVMASIKATLASPAAGERDLFQWRADRANKGSGHPRRQGGEFYG